MRACMHECMHMYMYVCVCMCPCLMCVYVHDQTCTVLLNVLVDSNSERASNK